MEQIKCTCIGKSVRRYPPMLDENGCDGFCDDCPTPIFNACQAYDTEHEEECMAKMREYLESAK